MKIQLPSVFLILCLPGAILLLACSPEIDHDSNRAQKEIALFSSIEQFNSAFEKCDVEKLEAMITTNYLHTNSHSKTIRKSDWINYLRKREKEQASGTLIVSNYKMDETEIEMYDDMAIVTAKISFTSNKSGTIKENEIRVTNIWVMEEGIWKRAGFHDSRIK